MWRCTTVEQARSNFGLDARRGECRYRLSQLHILQSDIGQGRQSERDFLWAAGVIREYHLAERVQVVLSPVFGNVTPLELTQWLLASGLQVRMQVQLHKLIWDPQARGV